MVGKTCPNMKLTSPYTPRPPTFPDSPWVTCGFYTFCKSTIFFIFTDLRNIRIYI